ARKHGVDLQITYADNDAINQSTQILKVVQAAEEADRPNAIIFEPGGGTVLYIQGPSENSAAKDRLKGMLEMKPANMHLITLKGQWTEDSAQRAVRSWLKLTTSKKTAIDLVAAQDDSMAIGARKAFQELPSEAERERWLGVPFVGIDGLPKTGQAWVRSGLLRATIYSPPNTGQAIDMLVD